MPGQPVSQDADPSTVAFVREEERTLFSDLGLHVAIELLEWRFAATPGLVGVRTPSGPGFDDRALARRDDVSTPRPARYQHTAACPLFKKISRIQSKG